jgi:hypothetical protein
MIVARLMSLGYVSVKLDGQRDLIELTKLPGRKISTRFDKHADGLRDASYEVWRYSSCRTELLVFAIQHICSAFEFAHHVVKAPEIVESKLGSSRSLRRYTACGAPITLPGLLQLLERSPCQYPIGQAPRRPAS